MRTLRGLAAASHPFPLVMVVLLTALIAIASSPGLPDAGRFVILLFAMLGSQFAIGWSNDYLDRAADALHQPSKPLPSGDVDTRLLPPAIILALTVCLASGAWLGAAPLAFLVAGTACGLAYDLGIKRTRYSALMFIIAFVVLLPFVWTSLDVYRREFLALYPIGLLLPVAAHIANVLPDLESDRAQGRRTIAVALGKTRAVVLALTCQLAPLPLTAISALWLDYDPVFLVPALAVHAALSLCAGVLYVMRRSRAADVWAFRLLGIGAVIFAAGWLASV